MKSDCCGAEMYANWGVPRCSECLTAKLIPQLTPEQVKAIRWPSIEQYEEQERLKVELGHKWDLDDFGDWAIRYALKDLMEDV